MIPRQSDGKFLLFGVAIRSAKRRTKPDAATSFPVEFFRLNAVAQGAL